MLLPVVAAEQPVITNDDWDEDEWAEETPAQKGHNRSGKRGGRGGAKEAKADVEEKPSGRKQRSAANAGASGGSRSQGGAKDNASERAGRKGAPARQWRTK